MQVIPGGNAQHGAGKAVMDAAAVAITFATMAGILLETRTADGSETAGAQMCRIATAAHCRIRMHALPQDALQQKLQVLIAKPAHAAVLNMIVFISSKIAAVQA